MVGIESVPKPLASCNYGGCGCPPQVLQVFKGLSDASHCSPDGKGHCSGGSRTNDEQLQSLSRTGRTGLEVYHLQNTVQFAAAHLEFFHLQNQLQ